MTLPDWLEVPNPLFPRQDKQPAEMSNDELWREASLLAYATESPSLERQAAIYREAVRRGIGRTAKIYRRMGDCPEPQAEP